MLSNSGLSANSICSDAAGVAGNVFALIMFMSPIPTFRRIVHNQSTEQFSGLPYLYTLLNTLIGLWYGLPLVSPGIIMIATVNGIGVVFQASYLIVFIAYANKAKKLKMLGLSISVLMFFLAVVFVSLQFPDLRSQADFRWVPKCRFHYFHVRVAPLHHQVGDQDEEHRVHAFLSLFLDLSDEPLLPRLRIAQSRSIHLLSERNRDDPGNKSAGVVLLLQECIHRAVERALDELKRLRRSHAQQGADLCIGFGSLV
ncbi:hypothetical protein NL676_012650 [Syzygium grande]|nr:hypothetical protein NL676_012650 [Syzygium grande]